MTHVSTEASGAAAEARSTRKAPREITGRTVLAIALGAFAVILTANLTLVFAAVGSFPGLVAKNSYVASQEFNIRAAERAALGWSAQLGHESGVVTAQIRDAAGRPVPGLAVQAQIGRPADASTDRTVVLEPAGDYYLAAADLPAGRWRAALRAVSQSGDEISGEVVFFVSRNNISRN